MNALTATLPCKLPSQYFVLGGKTRASRPHNFSQWLHRCIPSLPFYKYQVVRWPALIVPDQPEPHPEHVGPDVGTEDYDEPIQDNSEGEQAQGQEPEPDEDVDLFIDCNIVSDMCYLVCIWLLPMLRGRMQSTSWFSMLPEVPYLWKVHFVILNWVGGKQLKLLP